MKSLVVLFALVAVAVAAPSAKTDKRSLGHLVYSVPSQQSSSSVLVSSPAQFVVSEPVVATRTVAVAPALYTGASAVSHQSRVDVHSSPAVVTSYSAPVVTNQVVAAPAVYAPYTAVYSAPSAVSHQSRVDYRSSPAVVSHQVVSPTVVEARSVYAPNVYASYW